MTAVGSAPDRLGRFSVGTWLLLLLACQAGLLTLAGIAHRQQLNTDAVAYLRLAAYYAQGDVERMVSGYWGPLLSWLAVPWLKLSLSPLAAGRIVMGLSGLVFTVGAWALLRRSALAPEATLAGAVLTAGLGTLWSIENISPDLLLAGLICLALSFQLTPDWVERPRMAIGAGACWGIAYLAKAVAFPLAVMVVLGWAWLWWRSGGKKWPIRGLALTLGAFLAVASLWIAVLSVHYGRLTFSTSARIAHAVVGPTDQDRYHPTMHTLHHPEPGRLTSWEDPSGMAYQYWSPFASEAAFRHQVGVIGRHARIVLDLLGGLDLIHLGWFGMGMALWALWRGRANPGQALWAWCVLPVVCLGMVYLPVYVQRVDQRYFYGASPCLFACTAGGLGWLAQRLPRYAEWLRRGGRVVLGVAFGTPAALGLYLVLVGVSDPASVLAHDLAHRLRNAACHGPVAGSGMIAGGRAGLYAAFLLNESWYGDTPQPSAQAYFESGANLIVVPRNRSIVADLDRHPGFRDLDARLFRPGEEVSAYPLKVYSRIEVDVDGG